MRDYAMASFSIHASRRLAQRNLTEEDVRYVYVHGRRHHSGHAVFVHLGWRDIRMTAPLYAGDTLYAESEVLEMRESKSRPGAGLVTVRTTGHNQDRVAVCTFERTILVAKRSHGVGAAGNY